MGKELVISSDRRETRVAVLEDDQLVEVYFQRANEYSLAGSIHKGRVTRVLPGMQSAFVDIGLERDAFLYVSDFFEENEEYDKMPSPAESRVRRAEPAAGAVAEEKPEPRAAPADRPGEAEGRERKGRRSRRRRTRGRGFPESKYAPEVSSGWPVSEPGARAPAREEEFSVLPGESLAKYKQAVSWLSEEESLLEERQEAAGAAPADEEAPETGAVVETAAETIDSPPEEVPEAAPETAPESRPESEPAGQVPQSAVPLSAPVEQPEAEETVAVPSPEQAAAEGAEAAASEEEHPAAPAAAGDSREPEEAAATVAPSSEEASGRPAEGQAPAALTADVRERGSRYPHRVSRRLRRRPRGAAAVEVRAEEQTAERAAETKEAATEASAEREAPRPEKLAPSITDLLREGQEVLVQIAKEPLGQKGARITSHIALPGRYVVYMPTVEHLGVSRRIGPDEERMRLRRILQSHRAGIPGGFIIRTAGAGKPEQEIAADMMYLYNLWLDIRQKAERRPAPTLIHHDLDLVRRLLRDQLTENFKAIWVDNEEVYESVLRFIERFQPAMVSRVKMYTRPAPIFDAFNVTAELEKALRPKVWLKSGGYIVVNQTEALVAIDVNTGKFVGKSGRLEDTIVKTNTEAIKEIVRQIRLRDLGGIIVIDFIDMDERKNRLKVMQALEEEMRSDRAPYKLLQFNDFGLVAITRKRVKRSLERALCSPCPTCESAGYVKSVQTVIGEILQEARKIAGAVEGPNVFLRAHPDVAKLLKSTDNDYLEELEEVLRYPVLVTSDPQLHPEKFDLA